VHPLLRLHCDIMHISRDEVDDDGYAVGDGR
jgi:hypothetical protein